MPSTDARQLSAIRTKPRPLKRMVVPIFLVVFCFCALGAYVLAEARRATMERATEVATSLVAAIEADISRNIETVNLSLQAVVDDMKLPEIDRMDPEMRRMLLFDRSATARNLGKILVLDEAGNVRFDSKLPHPPAINLADRDYFQWQKTSTIDEMHISLPAVARSEGYWFVGISRRLSKPDGSFAGVAVASLRLSYFEQLFKTIALGPNGNITLSRADGIVLMRWPYKLEYIGLDLRATKLYEQLGHSRTGHFETFSATDGLQRLIVYSQIGTYPLVVGVGQTTSDIYAQWYAYAFGVTFVIAVLCTMAVVLTMYLMHELRRRREAEAKLAVLAATDALTSLSNRRHFNEILGREWQRGMRDMLPLALMMIDADNFKAYNDVHGHQAGDLMLKTLGAAIAGTLKRGGDIGARYGGDEFAVLLPATSLDGAKRVSAKIRLAFAELSVREHITNLGLSMGIASVTPSNAASASELVGLADDALYRAKDLGRNRTEVATKTPVEPAAALPSGSHKAA